MYRRVLVVVLLLGSVGLVSALVFQSAYRQSLGALAQRGEADLSLAADRLTGQLQRYQDLAVLMSDHPVLRGLSAGTGDVMGAQALLLASADRTGVLNMAYLDAAGRVLSEAKPAAVPGTAYIAEALERARDGALGAGHGVDPGQGVRVYVFAAPTFSDGGGVIGILLVTVNIDLLEQEWRGDRPAVLFTDAAEVVFISNRSELLGWRRLPEGAGLAPPGASGSTVSARRVAGLELWRIDWSPYLPRRALHLERDLPQVGMRAEALVDAAPVRRLAGLQATVVALVLMVLGTALIAALERRRSLSEANARLESRVAARTAELSGANARLRREVTERQEAEAALKRAQDELVQASKLSALGQMSAGLSHELNQPLMAIRQFAENGAVFLARDKADRAAANLHRIADLAGRMGRIIRNLRAFARQESEPVRRIDLVAVIETAVEMTEARIAKDGVRLHWHAPDAPVWAMGGEVRLGQVLVNLITNAVDAMAAAPVKELTITLTDAGQGPSAPGVAGQEAAAATLTRPEIRVRDTGPGIAAPEKIFDPFYSTKEVGASEGMGLGLSISYGLVQSFGGAIRGQSHPEGGAEFTVQLAAAEPAEA
ncbi:sensor histidine kinase [Pseudooceanicola sediminis]|uniref:C4-dicarboxylate transport sensor protein DctB n=1 Tax=Pseudooceanicola sediminis TaxID=2211117 RepID=A0A399IZ36_9RHOB|nr:ATP-binding protein [Pseudooceanicola sediminis]KAA2316114.1 sensor histidine kinase [Puniceibacterium sp. HSS470]RII38224.1 sensor histidine kinase [Pseudooceanicola sediminis]|tara:strand:+ start:12196 stop:13995 length:1800 start_codon:yes stop_codon:yes gene_type:complete